MPRKVIPGFDGTTSDALSKSRQGEAWQSFNKQLRPDSDQNQTGQFTRDGYDGGTGTEKERLRLEMITNMERTAFGSLGPSRVDFFPNPGQDSKQSRDQKHIYATDNAIHRTEARKRQDGDKDLHVGTQTTFPALTATKITEADQAKESIRSRQGSRLSNGGDLDNESFSKVRPKKFMQTMGNFKVGTLDRTNINEAADDFGKAKHGMHRTRPPKHSGGDGPTITSPDLNPPSHSNTFDGNQGIDTRQKLDSNQKDEGKPISHYPAH